LSTYFDTSTLLKLLIDEPGSVRAQRLWTQAGAAASVTLIRVEARAGLAAAHRGGRLSTADHDRAKDRLGLLLDQLTELDVTEALMAMASQLAEDEALRAYDAVHLAAALLAGSEVLTSADARLLEAASRQGLLVADPTDGA
jgi:uncharacterized protein